MKFALILVSLFVFSGADLLPASHPTLAQAATACPTTEFTAGESVLTLESGGLTRQYMLYIPASYDATQPVPLIFSIHGLLSNSKQQARYSGWNAIADAENFIVIYPQGTGFPSRWYSGLRLSRDDAAAVDDVGFIADIITATRASLCIDPARIYATGLSNGGGMSYRLACELADQIAAIGTVAGAYTELPTPCEPSRPVPVISFHGQQDPIVPYEGGDQLEAYEQWGADRAAYNGCAATPEAFTVTAMVSGLRYLNCDDNADVVLYTIADGGHTWPGGGEEVPEFIAGKTTKDIVASELMWAFFVDHPLPAAAP